MDLEKRGQRLLKINSFIAEYKNKKETTDLQKINNLRKLINPSRVEEDVKNNRKNIDSWCLEGVLAMLKLCDFDITEDYLKTKPKYISLVQEFYNYAKKKNLILKEIKKNDFKSYLELVNTKQNNDIFECLILYKYDLSNLSRYSHINLCLDFNDVSLSTFGFNENTEETNRQGGGISYKENRNPKRMIDYSDVCFVKIF